MQDYLLSNWQPLILVLLALVAGSIVLVVSEKILNLFNPRFKKLLLRILFYIIFHYLCILRSIRVDSVALPNIVGHRNLEEMQQCRVF